MDGRKLVQSAESFPRFFLLARISAIEEVEPRNRQAYRPGLMPRANSTGGSSHSCRSQTEIPDAMGKAFEVLASQYRLAVTLPKSLPKTVDVTLESPGLSSNWRGRFALKGD